MMRQRPCACNNSFSLYLSHHMPVRDDRTP